MGFSSGEPKVTTEERIKQPKEEVRALREVNYRLWQYIIAALSYTSTFSVILEEKGIVEAGEVEGLREKIDKATDGLMARIKLIEKGKSNGG